MKLLNTRLWTLGFVLLLILAVPVAAYEIPYNATEFKVVRGTLNEGNLSSLAFVGDDNVLKVTEVTGAIGLHININFTGIVDLGLDDYFNFYIYSRYIATSGDTYFQVWNDTAWVTADIITPSEAFVWHNFSLPACACLGDVIMTRFYHPANGNTNNYMEIDYFIVTESDTPIPPPSEPAEAREQEYQILRCPLNSLESTLLFIFIGSLIIGLMWYASHTSILFWSVFVGIGAFFYAWTLYDCNIVYGAVLQFSALFYILYEVFWRKFE